MKKTILVVDDFASIRDFVCETLQWIGFETLGAANGNEAMDVVYAEHPDLVIIEILMPTMDGFEFVQALRSQPTLAATQVIFYTATYTVEEAKTLADACGVEYVLAKPAKLQQILDTVNAALGISPVALDPALALLPSGPSTAAPLGRLGDKLVS